MAQFFKKLRGKAKERYKESPVIFSFLVIVLVLFFLRRLLPDKITGAFFLILLIGFLIFKSIADKKRDKISKP